ncbi:DedA family protein [Brevibacterium litoralis]|uniref:DedA family protein n=1 Tax=Brevibacterium litoralis TaxID=3138935 RepID=UPI0032ED80F8
MTDPQVTAAAAEVSLTGFTGWVVGVMEALGIWGVGLLVALENVFPPIPSEIILPLAGFTASQGSMELLGAVVGATLGSLLGATTLYLLGRAFGLDRLRRWGARLPLVDVEDVDSAVAWFHRHRRWGVLFGRLVPVVRSLVSIPAGVERMPYWFFAGLTTAGSLVWNCLLIGAGYMLGENWHVVEVYVGSFQKVVLVLAVVAVASWVVLRVARNRRRARDGSHHG